MGREKRKYRRNTCNDIRPEIPISCIAQYNEAHLSSAVCTPVTPRRTPSYSAHCCGRALSHHTLPADQSTRNKRLTVSKYLIFDFGRVFFVTHTTALCIGICVDSLVDVCCLNFRCMTYRGLDVIDQHADGAGNSGSEV